MGIRGKKKKKGGRRRNYEPAPTGVKAKMQILPVGWVNWTGFCLFGFLAIVLAAEVVSAFSQGQNSDGAAAVVVGIACGWLTYLFASTPFRDEDELAEYLPSKRGSRN